ncbi:MAG: glucosyltransferase domain-containing protein [Lachnospiraceae bacterium]|nr:glucosyltransferase domain-containing protein [Lachnospiraceae bacterium]
MAYIQLFKKKEYKTALLATLFFAILAHGYICLHKVSIMDDAVYQFDVGGTYTSGRWALGILYKLTTVFGKSAFSLPLFNSALGFMFLALTVCFFSALFRIKDTLLVIAVSGILVVYPAVTGLMAYQYTVPYYFFGLLLVTAGVYLFERRSDLPFVACGIVFVTCGIAIYQAYLTFAVAIVLILGILYLTDTEDFQNRRFVWYVGRMLLLIVASLVLYLIINRAVLSAMHAQMVDYRGMRTFGATTLPGYLARIVDAYVLFFKPSGVASHEMYPARMRIFFYAALLIAIVCAGRVIEIVKREGGARVVWFVVMLALSPLCFNLIFVITGVSEVHSLMMHTQVLFFFLVAALIERLTDTRNLFYASYLCVLIALDLLLARYANVCYLGAAYMQSEAASYFQNLAGRVQATEGYTPDMEVVYIGEYDKDGDVLPVYDQFSVIQTFPYPHSAKELINYYTWKDFCALWCGFDPPLGDATRYEHLRRVKDMPVYPADGSVQIIDGRIVVKFADTQTE